MAWSVEDAKDFLAILAGAKAMRDGAKQVTEAVSRIRDRHRRDATAAALLREAHAIEEAKRVLAEADDIERDGTALRGMFGGDGV